MAEPVGLQGLKIALFESRMQNELSGLVAKQGAAEVFSAPSIVEAPLVAGPEIDTFVSELEAGRIDAMLVLTGVGHRKLIKLVEPRLTAERLCELLGRILLAARGPKAVVALRESGLRAQVTAPEPHTWQDLLEATAAQLELAGKRIALQQYGVPHEKLTQALHERGASVLQVPVYRWQLPEDTRAIERNVAAICAGQVDVVLFTSSPQAGALMEVAQRLGRERELRSAFDRCALGSVGPSCTEGLKNLELTPDFEPEHGKMGHLVLEAARRVRQVLRSKRG